MGENVDSAPEGASNVRLAAAPLLLFAGVSLAIAFTALRAHDAPFRPPFFHLFFSNVLHMKAWLTTAAALLGVVQLVTALRIYEKLCFPPAGRFYSLMHRWSGRTAVLLTLPEGYHCILKLGFGAYDARAAIHSTLTGLMIPPTDSTMLDLPAPLGPSSAVTSPAGISSDTSRTTLRPPRATVSPSSASTSRAVLTRRPPRCRGRRA